MAQDRRGGGIVFSGAILALPHQRVMPNGDAYATLNKTAGILAPIHLSRLHHDRFNL
jgi:hypothetical protein